jgi:malonyl CoA-acyl carrier protein transacylase
MFEGPDQVLDGTENTQPAIFINSYVRYLFLKLSKLLYEEAKREGTIVENEIRYWFGHSLGEYNGTMI